LQVVSGDPGFYQSALAAVAQWRYKPTYLNGQPVEVETNISVIYNLAQ
jgi:protein TonB